MPLIVRAFPLLAGQESELSEFARQVAGGRAVEAAEFYRSFGVTRETWHLQQTDEGALVIAVTEVGDVDAVASAYAASERPFDRWFKDKVLSLTGVSPDRDPLGPPTTQIFEWRQPA